MHGWCKGCSPIDQPVPGWVSGMADAILNRDPLANVLAYNWQREASFGVSPRIPANSVPTVAFDLAGDLTSLASVTGGLNDLNMLGHSLGAAVITRVAGDPNLRFSPQNTTLSRLTLFDAPEVRGTATLLGGRVLLDTFIPTAKAKFDVVENYFDNLPLFAYGKSYSGIANTVLQNAAHGYDGPPYSPQGWYLRTIAPQNLTAPPDRLLAASVGFNESAAALGARYGQTWSNGVLAPAGYDMFTLASPAAINGGIYQTTPTGTPFGANQFPCAQWSAVGTATCAQSSGLTLVTHSPTWVFTSILIRQDIDAMSIFFRPGSWGEGDAFLVGINDQLIYTLISDYFIDGLLTTGPLDLSPWAGQEVTLSFGFLSDVADHWLSVEQIDFFNSQAAVVTEPSTLALASTLLFVVGLGASRRRRQSS